MIRTGSADFARKMVTPRSKGGHMPTTSESAVLASGEVARCCRRRRSEMCSTCTAWRSVEATPESVKQKPGRVWEDAPGRG